MVGGSWAGMLGKVVVCAGCGELLDSKTSWVAEGDFGSKPVLFIISMFSFLFF
jgi:hypothetical protein